MTCTGAPLEEFDPARCRLVLGLPLCQCDIVIVVLRAKSKVIVQGYVMGWTDEMLLILEPDTNSLTAVRMRDIKAIHFKPDMMQVIMRRMRIGGSSGKEKQLQEGSS